MKQPQRAVTLKQCANSGSTPIARERQDVVLSMGARYSAMRRWLLVSMNDIE
jgi:hypothetical protein